MSLQDAAILLGGRVDEATGVLTIDLLTRNYGRRRGQLEDGADETFLERGCRLEVELDATDSTDASTFVVDTVTHTTGNSQDADTEELVMSALKAVADVLIPQNEPCPELYDATQDVLQALAGANARWPIVYALWEFELLKSLGLINDLNRCRPAYRHGEQIYHSPRRNKFFTRTEAGAFLDKVVPVPGFLIGGKNATVIQVKQALELSKHIMLRHALPDTTDPEMMTKRDAVVEHVSTLTSIPRIEKPVKSYVADDADIKRRLLATRPLTVSYSITASR
ncbi:MAG: DNA repair protein RecO C-terminal domain-containing protein [Pseudomonadota bacterium]